MSEEDDDRRSRERYTPPEELGLDPSNFSKLALQPGDVTYTIKNGVRYRNTREGLVRVDDDGDDK